MQQRLRRQVAVLFLFAGCLIGLVSVRALTVITDNRTGPDRPNVSRGRRGRRERDLTCCSPIPAETPSGHLERLRSPADLRIPDIGEDLPFLPVSRTELFGAGREPDELATFRSLPWQAALL